MVDLEHATIPLLDALVRDGIVVHQERPGTAATWPARALAEFETDRPWYRRMQDAWLRKVAAHGILDGR